METTTRSTFSGRCEAECTRDVVFLFQRRRYVFTGHLPDGLFYDDSSVYREEDRQNDDREPLSIAALHEEYGSDYVVERWDTESVWLTREEATDFGNRKNYNYPDGWRVYGVPSNGELPKIIRASEAKDGAA